MAKNFLLQFGSGNPGASFSGLAPTFTVFNVVPGGGATTPPGITEVPTSTGLYYFTYEPLTSIAFVVDGATTGLNSAIRYIAGLIDPIDTVDEKIDALGTSFVGAIGGTSSSFGSTLADPSTVFGYLKRLQEFNEGNSIFTKTSGVWDVFARGNTVGASTMLIEKTITDSGSVVTKT